MQIPPLIASVDGELHNLKKTKHRKGSLTVVGTGIKARYHISPEAVSAIKHSDKALYLVSDTMTERWLRKLQPTSESLTRCYAEGKIRTDSYAEMVQIILKEVRRGLRVCVVFYGHPGVGVLPARDAIRIARSEGVETRMLPGISSLDCLFADLDIDPFPCGCQSFAATDFLIHRRIFDPRSALILWQIGGLANNDYKTSGLYDLRCLAVLQEVLLMHYPANHKIILYYGAAISLANPSILKLRLNQLANSAFHGGYTLYVPPLAQTKPDRRILQRVKKAFNS